MVGRLARQAQGATAKDDPYESPKVVASLRAAIANTQHPAQKALLRFRLAENLMNGGDPAGALAEVAALRELKLVEQKLAPPQLNVALLDLQAMAHLRQGEQDNCVAMHNAESCLLPLAGGGIHSKPAGSTAAMASFAQLLEVDPNPGAHWLLNVAAMTVGAYPQGVPKRWRIDPAVFASEHDIGRFHNVAGRVGVDTRGLAGGSVMEDFDGDGLLDLMSSSWGMSDPLVLLHNVGDGRFEDRSAQLAGLIGGINLSTADVDNDGDIDVFVVRGAWRPTGAPNSLLLNQGDGTFVDATEAAGLLTNHPNHTAAWADFDGDGHIDLFVGSEAGRSGPQPSELFRNNGDGTFTDVASWLNDPVLGFVKGAAWGDVDNDGRPELFVARLNGRNLLFHNDGPTPDGGWGFTESGVAAGVAEPKAAFATWFWDYDNDGWQDLFVAAFEEENNPGGTAAIYLGLPNQAQVPRLYRNRGDGRFEDVTKAVGLDRVPLVMGANFGDLDNDGWLDLYLGTGDPNLRSLVPNRMFRNAGAARFQDVTTSGGFGHLQKGHGVSFGDIDGDGDQDVHMDIGGAYTGDVGYNALFQNPGHGHHWLTLRVRGVDSNRAGIGARIRVRVATAEGERDIHLTVGTGGSFGANSLQQEVGLGNCTAVRSIEVRWPATGKVQTFTDVPMDSAYRLVEGASELQSVELRSITL
jgi:hypothetical protein